LILSLDEKFNDFKVNIFSQVQMYLDSPYQVMGNMLEKMRVTIDKDLDACYQVVDEGFEKVKETVDKDLDACYQVVDEGFEKVKVTIDKDLDKFMKSIAFFQR